MKGHLEVDLNSIMAQADDAELEDNIADSFEEPLRHDLAAEPSRFSETAPDTQSDSDVRSLEKPLEKPLESEKFGQERRRMILIIQMYLNEIPHKLAAYKKIKLEKLSNKELELLREEIEYVVGAGQNVKFGVTATIRGIKMFEDIVTSATKQKVNLQGLANSLCDQDSIDDIKCILIKHMDKVQMEPEARLGLRIIANAGLIYTNNSLGLADPGSTTAPPPPSSQRETVQETPSKFADSFCPRAVFLWKQSINYELFFLS